MAGETRTLREEMDRRRNMDASFEIGEIVAVMVSLISDLASRHADDVNLVVYPGAVVYRPGGALLDPAAARQHPTNPRDQATLPPECKDGNALGNSRASVFSVGAILYELLTAQSIGPGMQPPSKVRKNVPEALEVLLSKALVADASHRPSDLAALAQALHGIAPESTLSPPPADESQLDMDVDISLSMLLPPSLTNQQPRISIINAPAAAAAEKVQSPSTARGQQSVLSELKARLESDPRPRYVVVKDGMDHGPFNAVELLQQIASGNFEGTHVLRDSFSKDERAIENWTEFAPFAQQAQLGKEVASERQAMEAGVRADRDRNQARIFGGVALLVVVAAGFAGWYLRARKAAEDDTAIASTKAQSVDIKGGLKGAKGAGARARGRGRWSGKASGAAPAAGAGSHPVVAGGSSCESAQANYVEQYGLANGKEIPPDLTAGAYGAVLNRGTYLNRCGVPPNMSVSICAAVQNGRAVGVTVRTKPANGGIARCVSGFVRSMAFPAHPRLDVSRTSFKADGG